MPTGKPPSVFHPSYKRKGNLQGYFFPLPPLLSFYLHSTFTSERTVQGRERGGEGGPFEL